MASSGRHLDEPTWTGVFNRRTFHDLNVGPGQDPVRFDHDDGERLVGSLSGVLEQGVLTNGFSAAFGGIDFARPRETPAHIAATLDAVIAAAAEAGANRIELRLKPACYSENEPIIVYDLLARGFQVDRVALSWAIDLARFEAAADWVAALKSPARRALKHAAGEPWDFTQLELGDDHGWEAARALIEQNRSDKGRSFSIGAGYLPGLRAAFGPSLLMFTLAHGGAPVAAALVYRAQEDVWYVLGWGDTGHDLPRSPMNELAHRVTGAAIEAGMRVLDLGTSSLPEDCTAAPALDDGLVQFKTSLLARPHLRPVMTR
ncbi:MAG: GNAT family N-acetyltransferase [Baekduia sp.]